MKKFMDGGAAGATLKQKVIQMFGMVRGRVKPGANVRILRAPLNDFLQESPESFA